MKIQLKWRILIYTVFIAISICFFILLQPRTEQLTINLAAKTPEQLRVIAESGDADAQYRLGWRYEKGEGVAQDYKQAAEWYARAAKKDNLAAQNQLGALYEYGHGVTHDYKEALNWYQKSAEKNFAPAIANIARLYELGRGVGQDSGKATELYIRAANLGHKESQYKVADYYYKGTNLPQDYKQALSWMERAAEADFAPAQNNLATFLATGVGTDKDFAKAGVWYGKAAAHGLNEAKTFITQATLKCLQDDKFDEEQANYCFLASYSGDRNVQYNIGNFYGSGHFVARDDVQALNWYRLSALQGKLLAQMMLVIAYSEGKGTPKDMTEAYAWLEVLESEDLNKQEMSNDTRAILMKVVASQEFVKSHLSNQEVSDAVYRAKRYEQILKQ